LKRDRLSCHVTGIDLNPVAWFIVKTEAEPIDIEQLKDAFKRLEQRKNGKRQTAERGTAEPLQDRVPMLRRGVRRGRYHLHFFDIEIHLWEIFERKWETV